MKIQLGEIVKEKPFRRKLEIEHRTIEGFNGSIEAGNIVFGIRIQPDPAGFALHYKAKADTEVACVRCGEPMVLKVEAEDWISLRLQQPQAAHIVLDDSELNIRFIEDLEFDLERFIDEVIELELPSYPKHEENQCSMSLPKGDDNDEGPSPFASLANLLKK